MLRGRNVILGITGSIAAYKSAILCRLLIKNGANVKVVMTPDAAHFITPLTLSTLSKNPVLLQYFNTQNGEWNNHVDLAKWADLILIAPATANTIAKMANGICDNLLMAVYLSSDSPIYIAPAMDLDMYQHPSFKENIEKLRKWGNTIIPAEKGELASGLSGEGRMCEPEDVLEVIQQKKGSLHNKKILVSAGPTYEKIDPVRFIGNNSSGKMGFALANEAYNRGADVTLVTGPVSITPTNGVNIISVFTAQEMYEQMMKHAKSSDVIIMSAAVADYKPKNSADYKIKKKNQNLYLELEPTKDILFELGKTKRNDQILVGFALETDKEEENALQKLKKKNLDLIVLNSLNNKGAGFGTDTNMVSIYSKSNKVMHSELKSKQEIAKDILNELEKYENE